MKYLGKKVIYEEDKESLSYLMEQHFDEKGQSCFCCKGYKGRPHYWFWMKNGKIHRDNDLPARMWEDGSKEWYQNDYIHRENGPAYISVSKENVYKESYHKKGNLHREDGPAIIYQDPNTPSKYFLFGNEYPYEIWLRKVEEMKKLKDIK